MKDRIRFHALRLFDSKGFHGTSMRDIGDAAGCSMPTLYHHYGSKENLFDEVVRVAYIQSLEANRKLLPDKMTPEHYCAEVAIQRKNLTEDERLVHRLAMKTWLGCEGCDAVRQSILDWESARFARNAQLLSDVIVSPAWVRIITRAFSNIIERIVLLDEDISDAEIREEMRLLFKAATKKSGTKKGGGKKGGNKKAD